MFFVSFFQVKMLKSMENRYLHHIHLVLKLPIVDQYNEKHWRGLQEEHCHGQLYQDISPIFQSHVLNTVLR